MTNHENITIKDIYFFTLIFLGSLMLIYTASYLTLRDLMILKAPPCGKNKPLLAIFKYSNNYQNNYAPSLESTKFSYFHKKDFSSYSIFKPLERIELWYYNFKCHSLTSSQIAEIKKKSDWYRAEYKEMRIYDLFDESKTIE